MTTPISKADGAAWFGTAPPDLSVEARIRGKDWLYSYLLAFYRDEKSPTGWNNLVFHNVVMPHVLWNLSGTQKLVETEYEDRDKAEAAAGTEKRMRLLEECLVFRLGLGHANLDVRAATGAFRERVGHKHLGSVRHGQQRGQCQIVERTPVDHLLDDGVGAMHAVVDGADPAAAAFRQSTDSLP